MTTNIADRLAMVGTLYLKRMLEGPYSHLIKNTRLGKSILDLNLNTRLGIEGAMYLLMAVFFDRLPKGTPLREAFSAIAQDLPAELGKRIVNGLDGEEGLRENILLDAKTGGYEDFAQVLTKLKDEQLTAFLAALTLVDQRDRVKLVSFLSAFSAEQIERLGSLEPEKFLMLIDGIGFKRFEEGAGKWKEYLKEVDGEMASGIGRLTQGIKDLRVKIKGGKQ